MDFRIGSTHGRMQTGAVRAARLGMAEEREGNSRGYLRFFLGHDGVSSVAIYIFKFSSPQYLC